jgi:general secretion pathway protein D
MVVERMRSIVKMLDESMPLDVKFVTLKNAEAAKVTPIVESMLQRLQAGRGEAMAALLAADERLNQVVVLAPPDRVAELVTIVEGMDRAAEAVTKVYRPKVISPERLDRVVKNQLGAAAKIGYQATPDREAQALVVSASAEVHERIEAMLKELDVPVASAQSPIRIYKLKNTKAEDVLETISALQGEGGLESFGDEGVGDDGLQPGAAVGVAPAIRPLVTAPAGAAPATPQLPTNAGAPQQPPAARVTPDGAEIESDNLRPPQPYMPSRRLLSDRMIADPAFYGGGFEPFGQAAGPMSVQTRNATVAADTNTNSIIVIAPPGVQQIYAGLIARLDERRPQVQIECTIVTLDTTDGYRFGVDVANAGGINGNPLLTFTSFGVGTFDPLTGTLVPVPAPGGTLALLNPGAASIVLNALAQNTRSRLVSAPQLLVNDNGKGTLKSLAQEPYAEILDTTNAARTSLGGQATAGTTITVEPSISEDDYLQLKYSVELSAFTGAASNGLPPPSQTNNVDSRVTIPDGYTIVVGGLSVKNLRNTMDSLPVLRHIPVLNLFFGVRTKTSRDTTLFVFIRPIILRDDKFAGIKHISEKKRDFAGLPGDFPASEPIPIR